MEFDIFKEDLCNLVGNELGNEYETSIKTVTKNNGVVLTGIMAKKNGCNVFPTLYINDLYEADISGSEMKRLAVRLSESLQNSSAPSPDVLDDIFDLDKVRDRIAFKLINTRRNADILSEIPHRSFLDLTVAYYIDVSNDVPGNGGTATVLIRDNIMTRWDTDEERLYGIAMSNMKRNSPDHVLTMEEIIREKTNFIYDDPGIVMYVLTNKDQMFGASALLYGSAMKQLSKELDRNLYILPSSVHELILLPQDGESDCRALLNIVCEVNKTEVPDEEILADSVYMYDRDSDEVSLVAQKDEN